MEPKTNKEKYLAKIAGEEVSLPEPKTPSEYYLNEIAQNGSSGGVQLYGPYYADSDEIAVAPGDTMEITCHAIFDNDDNPVAIENERIETGFLCGFQVPPGLCVSNVEATFWKGLRPNVPDGPRVIAYNGTSSSINGILTVVFYSPIELPSVDSSET